MFLKLKGKGVMCNVNPSVELRERMGMELVSDVVKRNQFRWQGHVYILCATER